MTGDLHVIAGPEHWNRRASENRDAYGLSEARIREIVREEIEWAMKLAGKAKSPAKSSGDGMTPAAQRRQERFQAIAASYQTGLSMRECADLHSVCMTTVGKALRTCQIEARTSGFSPSRIDRQKELAEAYAGGLTALEVATKFGTAPGTVKRAVLACGGQMRRQGDSLKRGKPDPRIAEMAEMRAKGATLEEIGAHFKITRERSRQLMNGAGIDTASGTRPLKPEEVEAVEAYIVERGNLSAYAARLGIGDATFRNMVIRCGHVPHPKGNKFAERVKARAERVAKLYREGVPVKEIARRTGQRNPEAVYKDLGRAGIKPSRLKIQGISRTNPPGVGGAASELAGKGAAPVVQGRGG